MAEATNVKEPPSTANIREFKLGIFDEISAQQKGRVTRLTHPEFGTTYLIDVTDREDPTRYNPNDKNPQRETLDKVFDDRAEDPGIKDHYAYNNGVVVLITNRLDPEERYRIYSGVAISDPTDEERKEITSYVLHSAGFQSGYYYVPFSFDSSLVRNYMAREITDAVKESGDKDLFADFKSVAALASPGTT